MENQIKTNETEIKPKLELFKINEIVLIGSINFTNNFKHEIVILDLFEIEFVLCAKICITDKKPILKLLKFNDKSIFGNSLFQLFIEFEEFFNTNNINLN